LIGEQVLMEQALKTMTKRMNLRILEGHSKQTPDPSNLKKP